MSITDLDVGEGRFSSCCNDFAHKSSARSNACDALQGFNNNVCNVSQNVSKVFVGKQAQHTSRCCRSAPTTNKFSRHAIDGFTRFVKPLCCEHPWLQKSTLGRISSTFVSEQLLSNRPDTPVAVVYSSCIFTSPSCFSLIPCFSLISTHLSLLSLSISCSTAIRTELFSSSGTRLHSLKE